MAPDKQSAIDSVGVSAGRAELALVALSQILFMDARSV